jgi:hypothetical protein
MHALAVIAAAAAWSAPQTVSAPHTFEGPLYTGGALAAWNWQDGIGQKAPTGAGLVTVSNGAVSTEQAAPDGLVGAQAYDGGVVELASRQIDTRGRRWRVSVKDGAKTTTLATAFVLFRPQLSVAGDGSAIASWVELHGRRQIVRAATRVRTGRWSKAFTLSGRGQTTVLADAAGDQSGNFLVAFVRNGRLLARVRQAKGHWGAAHLLQRAVGKTHWQLLAAATEFGGMQLAWVRHRFTQPGHPGVRELFAAAMPGATIHPAWRKVQRVERDNAVAPRFFLGLGFPMLAYAFGPNSHAVPRIRVSNGAEFGPPLDAAPAQGGVRSVSATFDRRDGLVAGWVIPNPSGDGGGIGYAAVTGPSGSTFGPREQVTPNEAAFDMDLVNEPDGVRAFWTARPGGTGPSVPVSQVKTVVRTAMRAE